MSDVSLLASSGPDMWIELGDIALGNEVESSILISLFTHKKWALNLGVEFGSSVPDLINGTTGSADLSALSSEATRCLQWMVPSVFRSVVARASSPSRNRVSLVIDAIFSDGMRRKIRFKKASTALTPESLLVDESWSYLADENGAYLSE